VVGVTIMITEVAVEIDHTHLHHVVAEVGAGAHHLGAAGAHAVQG
jgi:hypothetical protein